MATTTDTRTAQVAPAEVDADLVLYDEAGVDEYGEVESEPVSRLDQWSDPVACLVAGAVLACAALIPHPARALVTLPLGLVLPGHALLAAFGRPDAHLAGGVRLALRAVLSLTLLSLVVLAVGWLTEVDRVPVVTGVWALVSLLPFAAWRRPVPRRAEGHSPMFTQSGVLLGLAALVVVALVAVSLVLLPEPRQESYHRVALTGSSRDGASPLVVSSASDPEVRVEVENGSGDAARYRLIPAVDGGQAWEAPQAVVEPGETRAFTVGGPLPEGACVVRLTVALSVDGEKSGVAPLVVYVRNEAGGACA